jgi:uncharacterized protein (TIGR03435 family)
MHLSPTPALTYLLSPVLAIGSVAASAQQPAATSAAQGKTFDVVSIRQNVSQQSGQRSLKLTPGPGGFQVTHMPLLIVLMTAYTPAAGGMFMGNIDNLPDWARQENYDIDARISDADRAAWNDPKNQPAMLQQMLQAMLADRFKLLVHRTTKEKPVEELVIAKDGPKLTETKPNEPLPAGQVLPDGGVVVPGPDGPRLYNFTMGTLASALSENNGLPVVDKTGLTGRYNIALPRPAADYANDPEGQRLDLIKSIGLKLEPAKQQVEFLVIDHIERPTAN